MTDRLRLPWPDAGRLRRARRPPDPAAGRFDEVDPALEQAATRRALGSIDLVLGAGDLEPSYLAFLADAFGVPLLYVRGNHDVGAAWTDAEHSVVPEALPMGASTTSGPARAAVLRRAALRPHGRPSTEQQVSGTAMWRRVIRSCPGAACGGRCWC